MGQSCFNSEKQKECFRREWDETVGALRKYFSADKSTVKENGGKSGRNGKD